MRPRKGAALVSPALAQQPSVPLCTPCHVGLTQEEAWVSGGLLLAWVLWLPTLLSPKYTEVGT